MIVALLLVLFVLCPAVFLFGMAFQRMLYRKRSGGYVYVDGGYVKWTIPGATEPESQHSEYRGGGLR